VLLWKDDQARKGGESLVSTVSFTGGLKDGIAGIEGQMKKGEMAG
jgi:hypothetical protein